MAARAGGRRADNVRIGPISIITLIVVICMAVLAVLSVSTANATMTISQRQAAATKELYLNECAAQEFVAGVDDALSLARASGLAADEAAAAVDDTLDTICAAARDAAGGQVNVTAAVEGPRVTANFSSAEMRELEIVITIREGASYRIDRWKAAAVQQEEQGMGQLWTGE